jgi:LuxR family transcriptional regulator, maltose regulon positive regulatory protein
MVSAAAREALVENGKLYPTAGTLKPLPRPRLDTLPAVLEGEYPVVVLIAPAGYGKSTLMAAWHTQLFGRTVPCAWLSLDEGDNDQSRFGQHLLATLQQVDPSLGRALGGSLAGEFPAGAKALCEALWDDLATVQRRMVLFLDDLHVLDRPEALEIVDWLVRYGPPSLQLVIATREKLRLRLSSLKLRRKLLELDVSQLQFDAAEISAFYRSRLPRTLSAKDLERVLAKTEGWPAAIELVALAAEGLPDPSAFIEHFAGTDAGLVDYLGEVVLSRLDEPARALALRISMFDRISLPLARAVWEEGDAEAVLRGLRSRNLFLIPLDRQGKWFRFHHLVQDFCRERFGRSSPAQALECLVRGARWLRAIGHVEEAINCMIRGERWQDATQWIAENVDELVLRRGYQETVLHWMEILPAAEVDRYPSIRTQYAYALSFYPRRQEYEALIYRLGEQLKELETQPAENAGAIDELRCGLELQAALVCAIRDDGRRSGELAAEWFSRWPKATLQRKGIMGNVLAFGLKAADEIEKGLKVVADTRRWLERIDGHYKLTWIAFIEALLLLEAGNYLEARLACTTGLDIIDRKLNGHPAQASLLHAVLAAIAYEFDEIQTAAEHIERGMGAGEEYAFADTAILVYITRARLQRLKHDESGALSTLGAGREFGERRGYRRLTLALAAEECTQLVRQRRGDEARLIANRFKLDRFTESTNVRFDPALTATSRYLIEESPGRVDDSIGDAMEYCARRGFAHRSVELYLIRALAFDRLGDHSSAQKDLVLALELAAPRNYLRVFLDESPALSPLLARLKPVDLRGSPIAPLVRRLKEMPDEVGPKATQPTLAEPLTRREVAILRRLNSGLSNREIAESIFVSEGTLKWHLHNVYTKLDVKNRSGAMAQARAMGIL